MFKDYEFYSNVRRLKYAGIAGTLAMIGYGIYDYKNRGGMSTSVYVMQYRVKAQSVVVGAMALGVTYTVLRDLLKKKQTTPPSSS